MLPCKDGAGMALAVPLAKGVGLVAVMLVSTMLVSTPVLSQSGLLRPGSVVAASPVPQMIASPNAPASIAPAPVETVPAPHLGANLLPLLEDMPDTEALTGGVPKSYRPLPIRLRSLRLVPSVAVAGGYNRLSTQDAASRTTGPVIQIVPQLNFDNGDAVNRVAGHLRYSATRYQDARANDVGAFSGALHYEHGVPELLLLRLRGSADCNALARTDINNQPNTREPVRYWQYLGELDLSHRTPLLGWRVNMALDRKLFSPSVDAVSGAPVDQSRRSHARWSMTGVITHQIRPGVEAIASVEGNRHDYDALRNIGTSASPIVVSPNSTGYQVMGGVNLALNDRLMGTMQVGYMAQNFEEHRIQNIAGLSYKVDLLYRFNDRANLRLGARKRIDESSSYASPGRRRTNVDLTYSQDLRENWRVSLTGNLDYYDYMSAGRQPHGYGAAASSRIWLNRNLSLVTQAAYYRRDAGLELDRLRYLTLTQGVEVTF